MPSVHPSERPQWGWLVPILSCRELVSTLGFYEKAGFSTIGGDPERGWAIIRNGPIELHLFTGYTEKDLLNFRGGDHQGMRASLAGSYVEMKKVGPTSFISTDPEGREVFFDTGESEVRHYQWGQPLSVALPEGEALQDRRIDLGNLSWCLACEDIGKSMDFYCSMGLFLTGGQPNEGWAVLARQDHRPVPGRRLDSIYLTLFSGMLPKDTLSFRGGDVSAIAGHLETEGIELGEGVQIAEDGGESLLVMDPDGRALFFETTPNERLY
jgi:hypothetical protein